MKKKVLLLDNFDYFTFNLLHQLEEAGADCTVMRNNDRGLFDAAAEAQALVLSPGPCTPAESGLMMQVIDAFHLHKPFLGICLGHQALGKYFGASLKRAPQPVHGKVSVIHTAADPWIQSPGIHYPVMRYHSLVLDGLPAELKPLAWSDDGCLMAMRHLHLPIFGVQFHPESIGTSGGQRLIQWFMSQID